MIRYIRAAIAANGGTPQSFELVGSLRELVTIYGGTPTSYDAVKLLRQAVTAVGGSPTQWTIYGLIRELLMAMGVTVTSFSQQTLLEQLSTAVATPPITATFDPAHYDTTDAALSNGNLTVTGPGGSWGSARSTNSHTTGDYYFEVLLGADGTDASIGLCTAAWDVSAFPGFPAGSVGYMNDGNVLLDFSTLATLSSYGAGDRINVAVKRSADKIFFGKNGTFDGDPAAGTGGRSIATFSGTALYVAVGVINGASATLNVGAIAFAAKPSGFNAWGAA